MDRGHRYRYRALLSAAAVGGVTLLAMPVGGARAQSPSPLSVTATPWVQAPPAALATPIKPPGVRAPAPLLSPASSPSKEEIARAMARKREEEFEKQSSVLPPGKVRRGEAELSPEERQAYERNLALWLALSLEERQALRGQATERIREETERAYQSTGLRLNDDQREVFSLRYRQERRRLEREIQEKAAAERTRRLPEILDQLKREFPASPAANPPRPLPAPKL